MSIKIEFSKHARRQMRERNLREQVIIDVLEKPQQVLESSKGRKVAQKIFEEANRKFLIRVIFSEEGDTDKVITVYLTSKIDKYGREGK